MITIRPTQIRVLLTRNQHIYQFPQCWNSSTEGRHNYHGNGVYKNNNPTTSQGHPFPTNHEHQARPLNRCSYSSCIADGHASAQCDDMPTEGLENPYTKPPERCILCRFNIEPDYKNVQLLSQFVSPHTGKIYDNNITGLCVPMHRRIQKLIRRSRVFGFMPFFIKDPAFLKEPKLFNPFKPKRPVIN